MNRNQFLGWLLIIFSLCVLAGMIFGLGSRLGLYVDLFVALSWMVGGFFFLRQNR